MVFLYFVDQAKKSNDNNDSSKNWMGKYLVKCHSIWMHLNKWIHYSICNVEGGNPIRCHHVPCTHKLNSTKNHWVGHLITAGAAHTHKLITHLSKCGTFDKWTYTIIIARTTCTQDVSHFHHQFEPNQIESKLNGITFPCIHSLYSVHSTLCYGKNSANNEITFVWVSFRLSMFAINNGHSLCVYVCKVAAFKYLYFYLSPMEWSWFVCVLCGVVVARHRQNVINNFSLFHSNRSFFYYYSMCPD